MRENETTVYSLSDDVELKENTKTEIKRIINVATNNIDKNNMMIIVVTDYKDLNKMNLMCSSNLAVLQTLKASEIVYDVMIKSIEALKVELFKQLKQNDS